MEKILTLFTYGAMSSKFSVEAENKLTAYVAMVMHYDRSAHLIALYEPEEVVKDDAWFHPMGKISERLDEIFIASCGKNFDDYCEAHPDEIRAAFKSIKRLI